jgi:hypothetical protein
MDSIRPSIMFRLWRRIVFGVGDWQEKRECRVRPEEYQPIIPLLQPGDVVLHRDDRCKAANWFIGGAMIHAGLYVGVDQIVEAISEGVVMRPVWNILESDYTMVVRPNTRSFSKYARAHVIQDACIKAKSIIGFEYDPLFDFCDSVEFDALQKIKFNYVQASWRDRAIEAGISFACTEVPYFCYYPARELLGLYRRRNVSLLTKLVGLLGLHPGEAVIDADMYVTAPGFDLIWCSASVSPGWATEMHVPEAMLMKLTAYWAEKRKG